MRYLHLFLIFSVIACYTGIHGNVVCAGTVSSEATESCHGADRQMSGAENNDIVIENSQKEDAHYSSCCLDSLVNSSPDLYSNAVFTLTEKLPVIELYSINLGYKKLLRDQLSKEHDPPDLQVSYSTFLL